MNWHKLILQKRIKLLISTYEDWLKPNSKVLDVGCGDGIVSQALMEKFELNLTGCDISRYLKVEIPFKKMTVINKIPFSDKSFDFVMFNDVLHHTPFLNQKKLLNEAARIARKSVLIIEVKPGLWSFIGDFCLNKLFYPNIPVPLTFRTLAEWRLLLRKYSTKLDSKNDLKHLFQLVPHFAVRMELPAH